MSRGLTETYEAQEHKPVGREFLESRVSVQLALYCIYLDTTHNGHTYCSPQIIMALLKEVS